MSKSKKLSPEQREENRITLAKIFATTERVKVIASAGVKMGWAAALFGGFYVLAGETTEFKAVFEGVFKERSMNTSRACSICWSRADWE